MVNSFHLIYDEQGGRSLVSVVFIAGISLIPPSLRATSPIFCVVKHPVVLRDAARGGVKCFECYKVWREEGESCFNREAQILLVVLRADFLFFETQGRVGEWGSGSDEERNRKK